MEWLDLRISKNDALVLYELLIRYEKTGRLEPLDPAERHALVQVHGALERAEGGDFDFDDAWGHDCRALCRAPGLSAHG